jgi:hypothetical protein
VSFFLALAPTEIGSGLGLYGEHCSMSNISFCSPMAPLLYLALREGGPLPQTAGTPNHGMDWDWFPNSRDRGMTLSYKQRSQS